MQVFNFYDDPWPSARNPLDSIVLSPHSIRTSTCDLTTAQNDFGDYQSFLPAPESCRLHDDGCSDRPGKLIRWLEGRRRQTIRADDRLRPTGGKP